MIPSYLSAIGAAIPAGLGNHLWQSTLCAVIAGLLTLILRRNQARVRYGVWLAASVKFLVPFSLLIGIGSHLPRPRDHAAIQTGLYVVMAEVSQPFTKPMAPLTHRAARSTVPLSLLHVLPAILEAIWLCGFLVVLLVWHARWRRIFKAKREAVPLWEGREVEALRRLERIERIRKRIQMLVSRNSLEPGVFGIVHPILIWPEGISQRLEDAHLDAILAHEVWHVRRRDNLAAVIHMAVEALFWFHPLVWWLGKRLMEERERACDEKVLESGIEQQVYAESILKACEFCVGSPLACVSQVTGADLNKRIIWITDKCGARKLDFRKKLLLSAVGITALTVPVVFGAASAPQSGPSSSQSEIPVGAPSRFETVSIKSFESDAVGHRYGFSMMDPPYDGSFYATEVTLQDLMREAYGVQYSWLILRAPGWLNSARFDVQASADSAADNQLKALGRGQEVLVKRRMLQALLTDRFKLTLHRETKDLPVYALVVAKNGPKLQESKPGETHSDGPGNFRFEVAPDGRHKLTGEGVSIKSLVQMLMNFLDRPVLDLTGLKGNYDINILVRLLMDLGVMQRPDLEKNALKGNYDINLHWRSAQGQVAMTNGTEEVKPGDDNARQPKPAEPSIFTALQEQLGLKLIPAKAPVEVLVIDHAEQASAN